MNELAIGVLGWAVPIAAFVIGLKELPGFWKETIASVGWARARWGALLTCATTATIGGLVLTWVQISDTVEAQRFSQAVTNSIASLSSQTEELKYEQAKRSTGLQSLLAEKLRLGRPQAYAIISDQDREARTLAGEISFVLGLAGWSLVKGLPVNLNGPNIFDGVSVESAFVNDQGTKDSADLLIRELNGTGIATMSRAPDDSLPSNVVLIRVGAKPSKENERNIKLAFALLESYRTNARPELVDELWRQVRSNHNAAFKREN